MYAIGYKKFAITFSVYLFGLSISAIIWFFIAHKISEIFKFGSDDSVIITMMILFYFVIAPVFLALASRLLKSGMFF